MDSKIALCLLLVAYGYAATTTTTTTTTTTSTSTFCSDVMSDDGTTAVSADTDYCGYGTATKYMEVCEDGDDYYILTSGVPDYYSGGTWCERWQYIKVSQTWEDSGSVSKSMGSRAFTYAGGNYFDHRSDTDGSSAVYYEGYMLDSYNGHSNGSPAYQYHYHAVPDGYSNAGTSSSCEHIGYMIDGGKLYGYCENDEGTQLASCYYSNTTGELDYTGIEENEGNYTLNTSGSDCHLDECNMYELDGEWVYITSANWPFVPPCLKGTVSTIYGFTPSERP